MRKYLNDIGIKDEETCIPNSADTSDERMPRFLEQREKYGFDERETWSLDFTFSCWLYEHLRMFLDIGGKIVDLNFYKFEISVLEELKNPVKNEKGFPERIFKKNKKKIEVTQEEAIRKCIEYLENYFKLKQEIGIENAIKADAYLENAVEIFKVILPAMWW